MTDSPRTEKPALLIWVLGVWLATAVFTGWMASANFKVLKLENLRQAEVVYRQIEIPAARRMALRYAASEINRHHFHALYSAQMVLAALTLLAFLKSPIRGRLTFGLLTYALLASTILLWWITPRIIELGREIDFVPKEPLTDDRQLFQQWHIATIAIDAAKILSLIAMAWLVSRAPRMSHSST